MNNKVIWITGASSGIGKALAIKFANEIYKNIAKLDLFKIYKLVNEIYEGLVFLPKNDCNKIEKMIMVPPIRTLIGGSSFINSQAHKGPNTASVNIKTPTTAEGVVCDPIVIKINPNPI